MAQLGFFDADKRLEALSAKGDPLEAIDRLVPWESFRAEIEAVVLTPDELKKSSAGRKPFDAILMFRMLVLQALNNLSDEQVEYQVRDRLSFSRFLGLPIEDSIPDATTLWLFREKLAKAGLIEKLFEGFDQHLAVKGYIARGGQIIDASIVPVPTQRNSRDENDQLRAGGTPAGWKQKPAKLRQKDRDARWTKKHGRSFFGYKNHVNASTRPVFGGGARMRQGSCASGPFPAFRPDATPRNRYRGSASGADRRVEPPRRLSSDRASNAAPRARPDKRHGDRSHSSSISLSHICVL